MTNPILSSTSDPFLTTKEAAQCLGVTLRTVQLWAEAGKLQAARTPGGHRRIRASDVRALQESMGIRPAKSDALLTNEQKTAAEMLDGAVRRLREASVLCHVGATAQVSTSDLRVILVACGFGADHA